METWQIIFTTIGVLISIGLFATVFFESLVYTTERVSFSILITLVISLTWFITYSNTNEIKEVAVINIYNKDKTKSYSVKYDLVQPQELLNND